MLLTFGLTVSGIGMAIVFAELVLLIFIFKLLTKIAGSINNRKESKTLETPIETARNTEPLVIEEVRETDDSVVAAIAAAIGYITQEASVITTIKRIQGVSGSVWSQAGRQETMSLRQ